MNLANVMTAIGTQLDTITGLNVYPYPTDSIGSVPAAVVGWPTVNYDETYRRGADSYTLPVWAVVSRVNDRTAPAAISPYVAGSGSSSIKTVIEAGGYAAFDSVRVEGAEIEIFTAENVDYWAARFDLDIIGTGA